MKTDRLTTSARYPESFLTRGQCLHIQSSNLGFRRPERASKVLFVSLGKSRPKPSSLDVVAATMVTIFAQDEQLLVISEEISNCTS